MHQNSHISLKIQLQHYSVHSVEEQRRNHKQAFHPLFSFSFFLFHFIIFIIRSLSMKELVKRNKNLRTIFSIRIIAHPKLSINVHIQFFSFFLLLPLLFSLPYAKKIISTRNSSSAIVYFSLSLIVKWINLIPYVKMIELPCFSFSSYL